MKGPPSWPRILFCVFDPYPCMPSHHSILATQQNMFLMGKHRGVKLRPPCSQCLSLLFFFFLFLFSVSFQ
ncbi:hypothetical protein I7I53_03573 [Histoplasma capsulatum var. duboisii H88]|uniref:Uncharacterized protein n=1 Tax=Ajellomyces capsulatus (strain H88) TaxID=544711 RepID=A0A8A1LNT9_AJEC8|nr:hypothetical protein I7I53_03573 [Histoplasma capsulatum var. duboisii H88]